MDHVAELYQPASPTIGKIAAALSQAQAELQHAAKTNTNPQTRSRYASLEGVLDVARGPLAEANLAIVQAPYRLANGEPDNLVLVTTLMHESGEWVRSVTPINPRVTVKGGGVAPRDDMQTVGAAITYARRYALASMLGIGQEDDDGNSATVAPPRQHDQPARRQNGQQNTPAPAPEAKSEPERPASERRLTRGHGEEIKARIERLGLAGGDARAFISHMIAREVSKISDLTHLEAESILSITPDEWAEALDAWKNPPPLEEPDLFSQEGSDA